MKSIDNYKDMIMEAHHAIFAFSQADDEISKTALKQWQVEDIKKVFDYIWNSHPADDIKAELTGDMPNDEELSLRLKYVFWELQTDTPFSFGNFLPIFDEAYYESDDFYNSLLSVYGKDEAMRCFIYIGKIVRTANMKIKQLVQTLKSIGQLCNYKGDALAQRIIGGNGSKTLTDERKDTMRIDIKVEHKEAGRPQQNDFDALVVGSDDEKAKRLHAISICMQGAKGRDTALIMYCCYHELQWLSKYPQFRVIKKKFGDIGNEKGFYHYRKDFSETKTKIDEIERMKDRLISLL